MFEKILKQPITILIIVVAVLSSFTQALVFDKTSLDIKWAQISAEQKKGNDPCDEMCPEETRRLKQARAA